jgi:hypothetical protein
MKQVTKGKSIKNEKTFKIWWRISDNHPAISHEWIMWDEYSSPELRDLEFSKLKNGLIIVFATKK